MDILEPLKKQLATTKGSGLWSAIASEAGCSYSTISRFYLGKMPNISAALCERLFRAIKKASAAPRSRP